jgi:hypothetical protein
LSLMKTHFYFTNIGLGAKETWENEYMYIV